MLQRELLYALMGTGFTCLATVLGAGMVLFFKKDMSQGMQKVFLGFAAGVMIAASVWSLLLPAMESAQAAGQSVPLHIGGGFVLGGAFLMLLDRLLPHLHLGSDAPEGLPSRLKRTTMVVLAVTLHNIPEGMAVGLAVSSSSRYVISCPLSSSDSLVLLMVRQVFPEGAAISLPLKSQGVSAGKSFVLGALSGVVEPVFGLLAVLVASRITGIMPFILSFAAGSMVYVVVEELIPEAHLGEHSHAGTLSVMAGFLVMMLLDVLLG